MRKIITDLWYGNVAPSEVCGRNDPKAGHQLDLMERNRVRLDGELNDTQKKLFEKYIDCADEYSVLMQEQAFNDGFSLGCRLMAEALVKDQYCIR